MRADIRPVCAGARRALQGLRTPPDSDIVHGLDVDLPAWSRAAATVATVHDCAVVDVPWAFPARRARAERLLLARTAGRADLLVTPSRFTASRLESLYGRQAVVTPLAAGAWAQPPTERDIAYVRAAYNLPEVFVLQVGTAEPRKLTHLLTAAAREVQMPAVFAGLGTEQLSSPGVLGLGHIPGRDLPALYGAATLVSYLTAYEGFGLPPLEAMACGAAVIASRVEPMPEVLGDAAILVRNELPEVAAALRDAVADPARLATLRQEGLLQSARFSWTATAQETASAYVMLR